MSYDKRRLARCFYISLAVSRVYCGLLYNNVDNVESLQKIVFCNCELSLISLRV